MALVIPTLFDQLNRVVRLATEDQYRLRACQVDDISGEVYLTVTLRAEGHAIGDTEVRFNKNDCRSGLEAMGDVAHFVRKAVGLDKPADCDELEAVPI